MSSDWSAPGGLGGWIGDESARYNANGMMRRFLSLLTGIIIAFAGQYPQMADTAQTAKNAFSQNNKASISESGAQLILRGKTLLDVEKDGFMSLREVRYSPTGADFLALACGYECNDNIGFVFKSDGSAKRRITAQWDYILQSAVEWSEDGRKIYYYRVNSTGADRPQDHAQKKWPVEGWVELNIRTMRKSPATTRILKRTARYAVFNVRGDDVLNVRSKPGRKSEIVGAIPHDAKGIQVTGPGVTGPTGKSGHERWAPIRFQTIVGWVNQSYLREESESFDHQQTRSK